MKDQLSLPGFTVTETGLVVDGEVSEEQWEQAGHVLGKINRSLGWVIGDWCIHGEKAWGHKYKDACERFEIDYSTVTSYVSVCRSFQFCRRRQNLSVAHHAEVQALPEEQQDQLLDEAEANGWNQKELREARRRIGFSGETPALPDGKFNVILADPPWRYEHVKTEDRAIENQYPTMEIQDICRLEVADRAAEDCVLFLWTTSPKVIEAVQVLESWDFSYRTQMVWRKDRIGMGYYARQMHETLWIATCGSPGVPAEDARPASVVDAPRQEHSKKPELFYEIIEAMYPAAERLQLFGREDRPGWTTWGNEV